jgi:hypothetical protein
MRCITRDRYCHPRSIDGGEDSVEPHSQVSTPSIKPEIPSSSSPDFKLLLNNPTKAPESTITAVHLSGDECSLGPTLDFVRSEMIRQIPSLTEKDAQPLSQMITDQLRRWNSPQPHLVFRRTHMIERTSRASVTIIDFECLSSSSQKSVDVQGVASPRQHHYSSTLVMSDIIDPEHPERRLGCLWAPAYDSRGGTTFVKEADHIVSVFRQCSGAMTEYRDRLVSAVAINAIEPLYSRHFSEMDARFPSTDAAIRRACAWGIVAAKSREIEYRLFAASLSSFLSFEVQNSLGIHDRDIDNSLHGTQNDLSFMLTPTVKISDVELGIMTYGLH